MSARRTIDDTGNDWPIMRTFLSAVNCKFLRIVIVLTLAFFVQPAQCSAGVMDPQLKLGEYLFLDANLSRDGSTSCSTCHIPSRAYADFKARSQGAGGATGTRNAPSLIDANANTTFFWDGRRSSLNEVVLDPFTNPVELGLASAEDALVRLSRERGTLARFRSAFPTDKAWPSLKQVQTALTRFVSSLASGSSAYDVAISHKTLLPSIAERGRQLFDGIAGCAKCHVDSGNKARFTDEEYHHSEFGEATQSPTLSSLVASVVKSELTPSDLGPKILTDPAWSELGRFAFTRDPRDIGFFRTPSLRNVAVTAPYMHDGSIATLSEAVDHEIYYRGLSQGHPINLTQDERQAIVAFLECLTAASFATERDPSTKW